MTRQEWHLWKKSLDPNYIIPSKEEDEKAQWEEQNDADKKTKLKNEKDAEDEAQRQREFTAFYNHT